MKKIRILALILALLMLPLGMLVSCKKDKGDNTDTNDDGDGVTQNRPSGTTTRVEDGTKPGYLCYYTFNNAVQGTFNSAAPYSLFQSISNNGDVSFVIGRRDEKIGNNFVKGGYLGIQRGKDLVSPYFDMSVTGISGFTALHVVSFDIYLGGGVVNENMQFVGRKGSGIFNNFVTFYSNGEVKVANKHLVYTASQSGEWVNFAFAISDIDREFDVYVNGVKTLVKVPYPTETYLDWDSQRIDKYRLVVNGSNAYETEMRIDNFAISSGTTPQFATESNIIYTDIYSEKGDIFSLVGVDASKKKILDIYSYSENEMLKNNVKATPYEASKLAMSNALSLSKIEVQGTIAIGTELQHDYGVELDNYKYGGNIGGKTFYSDPEIGKSYMFRSDIVKEGVDTGKLIVIDEKGREGIYILDGDEWFTKITIIIDNVTTYAVYSNGVFKTVSDATFNPDDGKAIEYYEGAFHGKDYSYLVGSSTDKENDFVSIRLSPDQINGVVDFTMMVNEELSINETGIKFSYDSGMLTFELNGEVYYFAYNMFSDEFTLFNPLDSKEYLLKPPASEQITASDSDLLGLHYQSFQSGASSLMIPVDNALARLKPWEKFNFELFIPENMVKFNFGLYLHCGENKYFYLKLYYAKAGQQLKSVALDEFLKEGDPDIAELTYVEFKMTGSGKDGTSLGPNGDINGSAANDGYDFYLISMALIQEKIAEVEGPKSTVTCLNTNCEEVTLINSLKNPTKCPKCESTNILFTEAIEYCSHVDQNNNTYLVPIDEPLSSSCTSIGYYPMRCTNCYATVIDDSKPITEALGHDVAGQTELTQYPTCFEPGYTYQICKRCESRLKINELPVKSHEYHTVLNNASGKMEYRCIHCGEYNEDNLSATLMSGKEKYELLQKNAEEGVVSYSLITYEGFNDNIKLGSFDSNGGDAKIGTSNAKVNPKRSTFESTRVDGIFCFELTKGDTSAIASSQDVHNPFFDIDVSGKHGAGEKFVFEFDIRPGDFGVDGKYAKMKGLTIDRSGGGNRQVDFFTINEKAELNVVADANSGASPIKLATDKFTNIAIAVDPGAKTKSVYVDGILMFRCTDNTVTTNLNIYQMRIMYTNGQQAVNANSSYYFNNVFFYPGTSPLCLVNTDIVEESKGELGLYENATPAPDAVKITEFTNKVEDALVDKKLFLKAYEKSSDFTLSFTVTPAAAFTNGTLLKAEKNSILNENINADILTVKDGYLYYMDVPVYKFTGAEGESIDISLKCEDYLGRASVSVNGKEVVSKRAYGTGDSFSASDSYVRNYTFCKEVGEYSIKNIKLVTIVTE